MDNLYSSFYLYRKYEIIGDELIDLGITSIDADGTQEAVMKEECDPACGCPEPIYRWVQTEDTVCVGEEPAVQYRWTPSGWTCVGYDKYQNNIKEQSLDEGLTWTVVIPEEYSASTLIESQSTDCGYVPPTPASPKFTLTLSDSSVVSAECDSTSAITSAETSDYHLDIISATIGDCVTTIGDGAFGNCMTLKSVTIPNSVTTIGDNAFNGCDLHEINLPNTLINLGDGAFKLCQYLQDVNIPVGYVPGECFSQCPNLEIVDFSPNTIYIGFGAFSSCYSLESIEIPSAIESINYEAFKNCENLASVYVRATTPPTLRNDSFDGTPIADGTGTIYVPCESVEAYKAASGWSDLASRIEGIPPCSQPTPASPKFIFRKTDSTVASAECDSSSAITSSEVSSYNYGYASLEIGECVASIGDWAFAFFAQSSVTISDSVTTIGSNAFFNSTNITSVTIGNSVASIGAYAFGNLQHITGFTIPSSVTSIGNNAFSQSDDITSITCLATTPPTLGSGVFDNTNNCPIYVPCASVDVYKAAEGWSDYSSRIEGIPPCSQPIEGKYQLTLSDSSIITAACDSTSSVTSGEVATQYSGSVVSAVIGDCVTSISGSTFRNCTSLASITIPNSVTRIGSRTFYDCSSLTSVTIPSGVTRIGTYAFYGCSSLTSVTVNVTTPPRLESIAFDKTNNCPIYVPSGSVNAYKSASGWSNYASRIQAIP